MKNRFLLIFWALILSSTPEASCPDHKLDWGFYGHKKINELAVFCLPSPLFDFYKSNLPYLIEHSVDPDRRRHSVKGEAEKHYIDLDHYYINDRLPKMPTTWAKAICQFDEDSLRARGIVPWHIQHQLNQLTEAFVSKDKNRILQLSAEIGHYIGDAHVPLHTTSNYNGQKTNQHGIHGLWESRIPEQLFDEYRFAYHTATIIEHPDQHIWNIVYQSHAALDSVFAFERDVQIELNEHKMEIDFRNNVLTYQYSDAYTALYAQKLNHQVERRMRSAFSCIADFWYTAWINAGQPSLYDLKTSKRNKKTEWHFSKKNESNHE